MKFKLSAINSFYENDEEKEKLEKLGFEFEASDYKKWLLIESTEIEINSLEELIDFTNEWGEVIISETEIEIYNGYRE